MESLRGGLVQLSESASGVLTLCKKPVVQWTAAAFVVSSVFLYSVRNSRFMPRLFKRRELLVYKSDTRIDGKVVIVTGANTGSGKETAIELAKRGGIVVMACRSEERGKKAQSDVIRLSGQTEAAVKLMKLDLGSLDSVRAFAEQFQRDFSRLDILILNAGVAIPEYTLTKDGYETNFATNHLGHFLLTMLLLDLLKSSVPSRVVTVAAHPHIHGKLDFDDLFSKNNYTIQTGYINSKLANVLFSAELARRLKDTGVTTYALHPGLFRSEILRNVRYINLPVIKQLISLLIRNAGMSVKEGAQTSVYCAVDPDLAHQSGLYYCECGLSKIKAISDEEMGRRLWDVSEQLVGLKEKTPQTVAMLERSQI